MGMLDTLDSWQNGIMAEVAQRIVVKQVMLGDESGYKTGIK
jgi:hypothetical protein